MKQSPMQTTHPPDDRDTKRLCITRAQPPNPAPTSPPPSPSQKNPMWLDAIPQEILLIIARKLHLATSLERKRGITLSIFQFASVSSKLRAIVCESLSYSLSISSKSLSEIANWSALFGTSVREISCNTRATDTTAPLLPLLSAPSLRTASLTNCPADLFAVSQSKSLTSLSVTFVCPSPSDHLEDALRRLQIRSLSLSCMFLGNCIFRDIFPAPEAWRRLAECCPGLSQLNVKCECKRREYGVSFDISPFVSALPTMRTIVVNYPMSREMVPFMRSLDSVTLIQHRWPYRRSNSPANLHTLAAEIGRPITAVHDVREVNSNWLEPPRMPSMNVEDLQRLSACPRMQKLQAVIESGAEDALPMMQELTSLKIAALPKNWNQSRTISLKDPGFHAPSSSFFHRLLNDMNKLRELSLFHMRVDMTQVQAVLRALGTQLELFGSSIVGQMEEPRSRLSLVMDAAGRHCPKLQELEFCRSALPTVETFPDVQLWAPKVLCMAKVLKRRAPGWNIDSFLLFADQWWHWAAYPRTDTSNSPYPGNSS